MYTEKRSSGVIRSLLINILLIVILVFILVWLFPTKGYFSRLFEDIFTNNINSMQEAAEKYYTNDRLPKNIGDVEKLTLREMFEKNLLLPFTDKDGNMCDVDASYVTVTKNENEYELKVYLSCNDEEAYIIEYLGCTNYCQGLGKCDQDCSSCGNIPEGTCKNITKYQQKRDITRKVETLTCDDGYYKSNNMCYKTTNKTETKDAIPVYESKSETKDATPKYEIKEESKDATPVYGKSSKYVPAIEEQHTTETYRYLYTKTTAREYSNWSDWSANKEYTSSDNIVWGQQELIWNEKNGGKKVTTSKKVTDTSKPLYQVTYDNLIGYYKQYTCGEYSYVRDGATNTTYSYGSYHEVKRYNSYTVPHDTISTHYQVVAINYEQCDGTCTLKPVYTIAVYERSVTKLAEKSAGELSAVCKSVVYKDIPVYGEKRTFLGYEVKQEISEEYVYYYHTKTRTVAKEATYQEKWSNIPNDETLLKQGYKYSKKELVSKDTKVTYSCPTDKNYTLSGDKCYTEESKITGYTCDVGTLKNKKCISEKKVLTGYTCPSGYNLSSDKCYKKSDSTLVGYKCDDNSYTLNGKKCSKTITTTVSKEPNKTYKDSTTTEYTWSDKEKLFGWEFTGKKQTTKVCNGKG